MVVKDEFRAQVAERAQGTPYAVEETATGFDVRLDIVDEQWFALFEKQGLTKVYVHHVEVGEGWYKISDDSRELRWEAGVPRLGATVTRQVGRSIEFGTEKVWAFDESLTPGKVVDYSFNSEEGRSLITLTGKALGLREKQPASVVFGIVMAAIALGGLLVLGLGVGVWALFFR